jgi:hypothetical protein
MITADLLKTLTEFGPQGLTTLIRRAGYHEDTITEAKFLGMTNGAQFCYLCTCPGEFEDTFKVFLSVNKDGTVHAEY